MRLRRSGDTTLLTVKEGRGASREETEVELEPEAFEALWPRTAGRRIEKSRRTIDLGRGLRAEADEYSGDLDGLAVVEVEFPSESEAVRFSPPAWFGRELTGDPAWANQSLAVAGRPDRKLEFRVRPGEDPAGALARVVCARTAQAAASVRRAAGSEEPAGDVHEARKAIKKARSALRLLRGVISDDERREANDRLRAAARELSAARDAEVKLLTLDRLGLDGAEPYGLVLWRAALESEETRYRRQLTGSRLTAVAASIEAVGRLYRERRIHDQSELVAANLGRAYRRGNKAMKRARKRDRPEDFHAWRRRAKDLRYQLDIFKPRLPDRLERKRREARELSEALGELHDLDVLDEDLASRELDEEHRASLSATINRARVGLIRDCLDRGKSVYSSKPRRFAERVRDSLSY